jgi:hypothetical protein
VQECAHGSAAADRAGQNVLLGVIGGRYVLAAKRRRPENILALNDDVAPPLEVGTGIGARWGTTCAAGSVLSR